MQITKASISKDFVVGTAEGAYQNGSCSFRNCGFGTGVYGTTIASADSTWDATTSGPDYLTPSGTDTIAAIVDDIGAWYVIVLVDQIQDIVNGE